jgi:tetratricopeptide (TPR) repeat protein
MIRACLLPFAAIVLLMVTAPALGAQTTFGLGPAQACYEAAVSRQATLNALADCDAAIAGQDLTSRDRAATIINRGVLHLIRRDPNAALADFDLATRLRPDLGEAFVNRGAALLVLGRWDDAIAAINEGLAIGAADPHEAYFNRAVAQERRGAVAAAYQDYQTAARLKPDWPLAQAELARFRVQTAPAE